MIDARTNTWDKISLSADFWVGFWVSVVPLVLTASWAWWLRGLRKRAEAGDESVAGNVILPLYEPVMAAVACLYAVEVALLCLGPFPDVPTWYAKANYRADAANSSLAEALAYFVYWLTFLTLTVSVGALFVQRSMSHAAVRRAALWAGAVGTLGALAEAGAYVSGSGRLLRFCDTALAVLQLAFFAVLGWRGRGLGRRERGLRAYAVWGVLWRVSDLAFILTGTNSTVPALACKGLRNLALPAVTYRAFLHDTRYWRGLTTRPGGGGGGVWSVERTTFMDDSAIGSLQSLISDHDALWIDFVRLKIGRKLAETANSKVYEGSLSGNAVAIKVFTPADVTEESIRQVRRETGATFALQHPQFVVDFVGVCVRPPAVCIVMELCARGSLFDVLRGGDLGWERRCALARQCCAAVAWLHEVKEVVHRDIKSLNFLVTHDWTVKLGDFGGAAVAGLRGVTGTPQWMAPEMMRGEEVGPAADVYSLAITLWEVFSGEEPYPGVAAIAVHEVVLDGVRPDLALVGDGVVAELLARAWDERAEARPAASEMLRVVEGLCGAHDRDRDRDRERAEV